MLLNKTKKYFLDFFLAQLVVTLISTPILIYWGLPISKISFIGNLIFLPILTLFLILSSLVFFTELLNVPNSIFIYFLNKTTDYWQYILNFGQKSWLTGFYQINIIFLLIIPILMFFILSNKIFNTKLKKILALSCLLIVSYGTLKLSSIFLSTKKISFENKLFVKKDKNNTLKIKDIGCFSKKPSPEKFIEFNLKPEIIKNFGTLDIKTVSIKNPGVRNFQAIIACSQFFNIKKVKLPFFNKKLTKYGWKLFFDMKNNLEKNNTKLIRYKIT
jgi:hypothetical protein